MSNASTTASSPPSAPPVERAAWRLNLVLFLLTLASVFVTGVYEGRMKPDDPLLTPETILRGAQFVGTVMTILVAHELGHYVAARIHKVDASLPFFLPLPLLSPFGTMGAVIRMRGVIPTRRALLDIGASGPLAGMVFAIPLYIYGVSHSTVVPELASGEGMELGESVLVRVLDHFFAPRLADGMTVMYSPIAFGAWGGMFVTMINLLPVGQLDGGHVAYALFGERQDRFAITVQRSMLVFFGVILVGHVMRDVQAGRGITVPLLSQHVANGLFWLVWFQVLAILGSLSRPKPAGARDGDEEKPASSILTVRTRIFAIVGLVIVASFGRQSPSLLLLGTFFGGLALLIAMEVKGGVFRPHDLLVHPPTAPEGLDGARKIVAIVTLALFALLFMPQPFTM